MLTKKVILGVTGGIAAYKAPEIVRRLIDQGAEVQVVMTSSACEFVQPLVFQAVSGNAVHVELLDEQAEAGMGHIELARWADVVLIAPATANTIAKIAAGLADDLLSTLCLATTAPIAIAPAMNSMMWDNAATLANIITLKSRSVMVLGPGVGSQACGETGAGRMWEANEIIEYLLNNPWPSARSTPTVHNSGNSLNQSLNDVEVLITAGPTRERIDPVRFISNHSSGKMGYALAEAAHAAGALVTLVSGPVNLATPAGVTRIDVSSALDMQREVMSRISSDGIFISVAAVADYRVVAPADEKIKKSEDEMTLTLERNPDILATVAQAKERPFCVGFAAETQKLEYYARGKLKNKNLDMVVANLVSDGRTFGKDENTVEVYWNSGEQSFGLQSKRTLADSLIALISDRYSAK